MKLKQLQLTQEQIKMVRLLADQGNPKAQHNLGAMYMVGQGVERDLQKAILWFKKSAEQGEVLAQHNLGVIYLQGVEKQPANLVEAAHWFTMAAMQGEPRSQHTLGGLYFEGLGVDKNLTKSYVWLSLALQTAPEERQNEIRQVRDYVASQLSPEEIADARNTTLDIIKKMTVN